MDTARSLAYLFFVCMVFAGLFHYILDKRNDNRIGSVLHYLAPALVLAGVWLVIVGINAFVRYENYQYDDYKTRDYPLKEMTMGTKDTSDGWYFLIAGGAEKDSEQRFYYYVQSPDGTVKLFDNNVKNINFVEDVVLRKPEDTYLGYYFRNRSNVHIPHVTCMLSHEDYDDEGVDARFMNDGYWVNSKCVFHIPEHSIGTKIDTKIRVK